MHMIVYKALIKNAIFMILPVCLKKTNLLCYKLDMYIIY